MSRRRSSKPPEHLLDEITAAAAAGDEERLARAREAALHAVQDQRLEAEPLEGLG